MKIGYARVSSTEQNLEVQLKQLQEIGCEKIYQEKVSGKSADRPELISMLDFARAGDIIHVTKTDRLARSTIDALQIADELEAKGVGLVLHDLGDININSQVGKLIYTVISSFAELEKSRILQRCAEGRALAKSQGKHLGRYKNEKLHAQIKEFFAKGMNKNLISKTLKCSRTTIYRVLNGSN
ncbi:MAG: recombinase family protein [Colwellia sp.]|nr:recombinase family protein [Colwellia sp.]MCW8864511.1 recombinase family protein [Colwellia sp.]MCW9082253.1 recombinase family protein [Colwellia sp.]